MGPGTVETARIMKRHSAPVGGPVTFQFEDVTRRAERYKEEVSEQCRQLVLEATAEADRLRTQAVIEGRTEGLADGLRTAKEQIAQQARQQAEQLVEQQLKTALPALTELVAALSDASRQCQQDWEREFVLLSVAVADRLVRTQLARQPERIEELVRDTLELAAGRSSLRVLLHARDLDTIGDRLRISLRENGRGVPVELVADSSVPPGGCRVISDHGEIDARLETMLDRITTELLEGLAP